MTYAEFVAYIQSLGVFDTADTEFTAIIPAVIQYAEGRIYRELDALAQHQTNVFDLTANNRDFSMSAANPKVLIPETINVITPAATLPNAGTRTPLFPVHRDYMDMVYGTVLSATGIPSKWAAYTEDLIRVAPTPNAAYKIEVVGKFQPAELSASNTTTYLTLTFPDLFLAAAMVFVSGYERNYGAQASDPETATSWEAEYQRLKGSAVDQIERQKGRGLQSTPYRPPVIPQSKGG